LASLNTARGKGNDAKVKAQLSGARAAAEIYYDNNGNYGAAASDLCSAAFFTDTTSKMGIYTTASNYPGTPTITCRTTGTDYAISIPLDPDNAAATDNWCVDSSGNSKAIADALGAGIVVCP